MLSRAFAFLVRHATIVLAAGIVVGFAVPALATLLRPALPAAVWGMLFLSLVRVDWGQIAGHLSRPAPAAWATVFLLGLSPVVVAIGAHAVGAPAGLTAALVLFAASPPLVTTPALAVLLGLDAAFALVVVGATTMLAPLTIPFVGFHLLDLGVGIDGWAMLRRLALFVGTSFGAAAIARRVVNRDRLAAARSGIDAAVVLLLLVFAIGIMDGTARRVADDPARVLGVVGLVFAVYALLQVLGALAFCRAGRGGMLTVAFATANRNFALTVALLPATAPPDIFLFFVAMQVPIYLLPAVLKPIYASWLAERPPDS